jgi:serine/threonine protein kinase
MHSTAASTAELDLLVDQLTDRLRAGEVVDFDAVLRDHPEHAVDLREILPALALMVGLSWSAVPGAIERQMGELGDFRLLREVGRGGMGIVYEAEQMSLGRRVALKVLPYAATMDPKQLQRFKNEAKAAASLKHDHIVSVYAVGCERGVHYYAMEFIEGASLAQIIAGRSRDPADGKPRPPGFETADFATGDNVSASRIRDTAPLAALSTKVTALDRGRHRRIAELIADAADALEHAHSLGIVHRDVKPGNLIVDETGRVYVADFGLARFGPDAGLTMSGDLLGTLRYMAPEQALARHGLADHRVDVYGLGATLYELLTSRPAVDGTEKAEILHNIAFEEAVALRKHEKQIPAELETIALKCLAKNPNERYATAGELAADLRRYCDDKPIKAKPPTTLQRAARRLRRHPRVLAAAFAVAVLAAVGAMVSAVLIDRQKQRA